MTEVHKFKYKHQIAMGSEEFANVVMTWSGFQALPAAQKLAASARLFEGYRKIFGGEKVLLGFEGKSLLFQFK
jgi:hypothetical protein